jgi:predicted ArsR family transcriptional regulator
MSKPTPSPIGGAADDLAAVLALRELVELREDAAVERALREDWTWSQVAEALGVTRQAVHKRHLRRVAAAGISLRRRNE